MQYAEFKEKYQYEAATQVMRQYLDVKFAHLECLVLFRMGDFYELFYEDAITASRILGIALTKRGKTNDHEIPMCGVPHHALENYLNKLLEDDFKVAICDQLETPDEAKNRGGYKAVVRRDVTRIITPGTIIEESLLSTITPNYLVNIAIKNNEAAIAYVDLSTSYIAISTVPESEIINELAKLAPREILLAEQYRCTKIADAISNQLNKRISFQVDSFYSTAKCQKNILDFYQIHDLKAIGELTSVQISALGGILQYITLTQKEHAPRLPKPKILSFYKFMSIDASTRKNLELTETLNGNYKGSLFSCINKTVTKSGGRLLHQALSNPLIDINLINLSLNRTEFFTKNIDFVELVRKLLKQTGDLERCITRLNMGRSTPKDLLSIKYTIEIAQQITAKFITEIGTELPDYIDSIINPLFGLQEIYNLIDESISENAQNNINDGGIIKHGYNPRIDELNDLMNNGQNHVLKLRDQYRAETGIDGLKISNNNILGLFIEITTKHANKITDEKFIHKQSTINAVRYTTKELQDIETNLINARSNIINLEREIYANICQQLIGSQQELLSMARSLALLDLFCNFALVAEENSYTRPILSDDTKFNIKDGRHPIVEQTLKKSNQSFVGNGCNLDFDNRIWLITGPNMAGKSTFLRQNAIITILAQIGCFVPANKAEIGIVDKIFSRIGAGDDLGRGQSTFMLEMLETSTILAQATHKSLVILDEVGRGTSTYDGVAIAWSVLEYIHDKIKSRCLFATHYHELTQMTDIFPALLNYTVDIKEQNDQILFLHKIKPGFADKSYGVHVAEIAGLPKSVISKAKKLLAKLEKDSHSKNKQIIKNESINLDLFSNLEKYDTNQQPLISPNQTKLLAKLSNLNPDSMSPKEALDALYELKNCLIDN